MTTALPEPLIRRLALLAAAPRLLVCSDYDGTLAPIASRPEQAQLLPDAFNLLHGLARLPETRVAIISGRARDNLRAHSGLGHPILLVGSHGAELPAPDTDKMPDLQARLTALESSLAPICARFAGTWLEHKPFGITVHVRGATGPDAEGALEEARSIASRLTAVHVTEGKAVVELSLSAARKGDAVNWLRTDWGMAPQVLYIGDDVTDEHAFAALSAADVGIKIGHGPSLAGYRVMSELMAVTALELLWKHRNSMPAPHAGQDLH